MSEIKIGQKFYGIDRKINIAAQKVFFTDAEGVRWYRYTEPRVSFSVEEWQVTGAYWTETEGQCYGFVEDWDKVKSYVIRRHDGSLSSMTMDDYAEYFDTREEAEQRLRELEDNLETGEY